MCLTRLPAGVPTPPPRAALETPKTLPTAFAWTPAPNGGACFRTNGVPAAPPRLMVPVLYGAPQTQQQALIVQLQQQQMILQHMLMQATQNQQPAFMPQQPTPDVDAVLQRLMNSARGHQRPQPSIALPEAASEAPAPLKREAPAPYMPVTSKFRGVSWHRRDKVWLARAWLDGKIRHLGCFKAEEMAALAVDLRHIESFGEAGRVLNFPERQVRADMLAQNVARGDLKLRRAANAAQLRMDQDDAASATQSPQSAEASAEAGAEAGTDSDASDAGSDCPVRATAEANAIAKREREEEEIAQPPAKRAA